MKRFVTNSGQTSTSLRHTSRVVDEAVNVDVVGLQCLLVDVVCHAGTLASDYVDIYMPKLRPYR